ncbi:hypothetical protein [Crocosphaera sp. XPORK-15E]|uniref:hypothetical protein n=1 Tax=Crocosphaera sp. XPORK-15E TaxID=3110247 RepID=UPI002B21A868|nr:hypothetical protein [Crocosphaera sp. XPORK-15E]MEA5533415.1 hypothetical protein [Crocosphaera sp. XPORK-15E]
MSNNPNFPQPMGPLSVGNVVSAALRIYRDNFKLYYTQALLSYFWLFVPIYGWAKFSAIQGLIARLAFHEAIERPETIYEARQQIQPRMWTFFIAGLLVGLIVFAALIGYLIVVGIVIFIIGSLFRDNTILAGIIGGLFGFLSVLVMLFGYVWIFSRLSIVELPIAVESPNNSSFAIGRSWNLTQGFVLRLQLIFFVAFLITIPLSLVVNIVSIFLPSDSPLTVLINLVLSIGIGALFIPFWQGIKAVIYYDLRSRKEGLGLDIKDRLT